MQMFMLALKHHIAESAEHRPHCACIMRQEPSLFFTLPSEDPLEDSLSIEKTFYPYDDTLSLGANIYY